MDLNSGLTQALSDETHDYIYGIGRIAQVNGSAPSFFLTDALGSVRQLTDSTGSLTFAQAYAPYGTVAATSGSGATTYGFTGEYQNQGLVYLRARHYAPSMGRFLTRDTWGGNPKIPTTYNRWAYANANPIMLVDPLGKFASPYAVFTGGEYDNMDMALIHRALEKIARAYTRGYYEAHEPCNESGTSEVKKSILRKIVFPIRLSPVTIFYRIHGGPIDFERTNKDENYWAEASTKNNIHVHNGGLLSSYDTYKTLSERAEILGFGTRITTQYWYEKFKSEDNYNLDCQYAGDTKPNGSCDKDDLLHRKNWIEVQNMYERFITHEVGHTFNIAIKDEKGDIKLPEDIVRSAITNNWLPSPANPGQQGGFCGNSTAGWQFRLPSQYNFESEVFADMFIGWVNNCFDTTISGGMRADFMNQYMPIWIFNTAFRPSSVWLGR